MAELTSEQRQELAREQANLCSADQLVEAGQPITQSQVDGCEAAVEAQFRADLEPRHEPKAGLKDAACFLVNEFTGSELGGLCPASNAAEFKAGLGANIKNVPQK